VATGRKVAEAAARAFIPANLELGGNDPLIITASADPVEAACIALRASCAATGQACQSIERIYVARPIFDAFVASLVEQARAIELSYPDPKKGHIGPFIFAPQAEKVAAQLEDAVRKGARVLSGGKVEELGGGLYLRPTVLTGVTAEMDILRHETFGPVMPVVPYDSVEDAIRAANDTAYGLSAAVIAGSLDEAEEIGLQLDAGAISLNDGSLTSMVGDVENTAFKHSGLGPSRMGDSGFTRFFRTKALIRQHGRPMGLADFAEDAQQP
jgi:acyl-CoA reductase-like NAD-dependent aldehyde dehydrogenase